MCASIEVDEARSRYGFGSSQDENSLSPVADATIATVHFVSEYTIDPVGVVRSSRIEAHDDRWDAEVVTIELLPPFDERSVRGLVEFSHCIVVFLFDRASWDSSRMMRHPRGNSEWPKVGIFAQRAKDRPNRLGVSVCRILAINGSEISVAGLDAIEGTPVVDIKPWMTEFGARGEVSQPRWATELMKDYW